jgi:hypothetical protein
VILTAGMLRKQTPIPELPLAATNVAPLRDDAFQPHPAGMLEDERAIVVVEMLVQPQPRRSSRNQAGQRGLAYGKRIAAKIIAVQLDEIEGPEENAIAIAPVAHALEACDAILAAGDSLAVDDAGACAETAESIDDAREAVGQIIARQAAAGPPLAGREAQRQAPCRFFFMLKNVACSVAQTGVALGFAALRWARMHRRKVAQIMRRLMQNIAAT